MIFCLKSYDVTVLWVSQWGLWSRQQLLHLFQRRILVSFRVGMAHWHRSVSGLQCNQWQSFRVVHVNWDESSIFSQIPGKNMTVKNILGIRMTGGGVDYAMRVVLILSPPWKLVIIGIRGNHCELKLSLQFHWRRKLQTFGWRIIFILMKANCSRTQQSI